MFKDDSDSDEEGILSRAHANIAEKAEKGLDPSTSFTSVHGNESVNLTQESTDLTVVDTGNPTLAESDSFEFSYSEFNTSELRRSPRIRGNSTVDISNSDGITTSRRGRGRGKGRGRGRGKARSILQPDSTDESFITQKRRTRTKRGRKNNSDVISIGSDDEDYNTSYAIPPKNKAKAKAGSKLTKNAEQIETVSLPSDDETPKNDYMDDIINVKIEWMCEGGLIIPHGRTQQFAKLYEQLAIMKGYDVNKIYLCKKDGKVVKPHETPLSIKLSIIDILVGSVSSKAIVNKEDNNSENPDANSENCNGNLLNFKILVEGQKAPCYVKIEKDQTMHVLLTKLAGQLNSSADKMRLWFDGELIKLTDTPVTLELEGDECLELKFKKS